MISSFVNNFFINWFILYQYSRFRVFIRIIKTDKSQSEAGILITIGTGWRPSYCFYRQKVFELISCAMIGTTYYTGGIEIGHV